MIPGGCGRPLLAAVVARATAVACPGQFRRGPDLAARARRHPDRLRVAALDAVDVLRTDVPDRRHVGPVGGPAMMAGGVGLVGPAGNADVLAAQVVGPPGDDDETGPNLVRQIPLDVDV